MQTKAKLVCLSLMLLSGPCRRTERDTAGVYQHSPEAARLIRSANDEYARRDFDRAYTLYQEAHRAAAAGGDLVRAGRALNNLGGCALAMLRYREALLWYYKARPAVLAAGDRLGAAAISLNLSSLHFQLGELSGAGVELRRGLEEAPETALSLRAALELQQAKIDLARLGLGQAERHYASALRNAELAGDRELAAKVWNNLGSALLQSGELARAEDALMRAFLVRRLSGSADLGHSWLSLALLRLAQGDLGAAENLAARAVAVRGSLPRWRAYHCRAQVRMKQGRWREAVNDLRQALRLAHEWRVDTLPGDAFRIGADAQLGDLYAAFTESIFELHRRTGSEGLLAEGLGAAEQGRAASLRSLLIQGGKPLRDAPEYASTLARLRDAQARLGAKASSRQEDLVHRLGHQLAMLEVQAGLARTAPPPLESSLENFARQLQQALSDEDALLSVETGHPFSYLYAVTRRGIRLRRLPSERLLERSVAEMVAGLRAGAGEIEGQALYQQLFGGLDRAVTARSRWYLTLSGPLLAAPLAACHDGRAFLVERKQLVLLPSAHFLLNRGSAAPEQRCSALFVGDPVYNAADPRARRRAGLRGDGRLQLARLAGSAGEIRNCAAAWRGPVRLLEGAAASRTAVLQALRQRPGLVHFATHVIEPGPDPAQGSLALSLSPAGVPEYLTAYEIAAQDCPARLVVLSACRSAGAEAKKGTGLLGLTRAWIGAGAKAVVATLWPVSDSGEDLFRGFYERLCSGDGPAEALRRSQVMALGRGGRDRSWAAYVLVRGG